MIFLPETLFYIISAPFFWQAIGFSIATAMFIGAAIFNGDVSKLTKTVVVLLSYAFYLMLITATRVTDITSHSGIEYPAYANAGMITIVIMTVAYIVGMYAGVITVKLARRKK